MGTGEQPVIVVAYEMIQRSKTLNNSLFNGFYRFAEGAFTLESGIEQHDGESCPSLEYFHVQFRLEGEFKENPRNHAFD